MWLALLLAAAQIRTIVLPQDGAEPVRIVCPVHRTTRIVFPEAMRSMKGMQGTALGMQFEENRSVLIVQPTSHLARAALEFRGKSLFLLVELESTLTGEDGEVHLVPRGAEPSPSPAPAPSPAIDPADAGLQSRDKAPSPAPPQSRAGESAPPEVGSPAPEPPFDLADMVRSKVVPIGRTEGLPGHLPMVLEDAFQGQRGVLFRFNLRGGARSRVARVTSDRGEVQHYTQEVAGKDLRIFVPLLRATVTDRSHLAIELESGPTYTFSLGSRSLGKLLRELFQ